MMRASQGAWPVLLEGVVGQEGGHGPPPTSAGPCFPGQLRPASVGSRVASPLRLWAVR